MTEQVFVSALITYMAQQADLHIQYGHQWKGKLILQAGAPGQGVTHFVLLVDCRAETQVKTQIIDNYQQLQNAGYDAVIGLRDVYPIPLADVPKVEAALAVGLPVGSVPVALHLAITEIETWFLAETTHFAKIDAKLTLALIAQAGVDLLNVPPQQWHHAAAVLDGIYSLVGLRYTTNSGSKQPNRVKRTVRALDMDHLLNSVRGKVAELDAFVGSIEAGMGLP